jgi:alkylation response protein AidB-like acyl-CoA dehydrogenase
MDFSDTPEEAAYREKVRTWLRANAPKRPEGAEGAHLRRRDFAEVMEEAQAWQAKKAAAGFAAITKPKEWGGAGGSTVEDVIFTEEEQALGIKYGVFSIGIGMMVPTILAYADEETKSRLVPPTIRGEKLWSQLFSEPGAGSDLGAVRCRATRSGDSWVVTGQKVWNSNAHLADYGLLLTRTDFDTPKHRGMTMFWIDMKNQPGLEVRQLHQISGASDFNECHFDSFVVPDSQRLGAVGDGWKVAMTTLMNERVAVGEQRGPDWPVLLELARRIPAGKERVLDDAAFRERLADIYVRAEGVKLTRSRVLTALSRGQQPGPQMSIGKLVLASLAQEMSSEAIDMCDQFGIIDDPAMAPLSAAYQQTLLLAPGFRIAGGTDEILRNIIAERVLGLPAEARVDKDIAFRDIPTGARR